MANKNNNTCELTYTIEGLATIALKTGDVVDYAQMRASQLSALTSLLCCDDFQNYNNSIQNNVLLLVCGMASEVEKLISMLHRDVRLATVGTVCQDREKPKEASY